MSDKSVKDEVDILFRNINRGFSLLDPFYHYKGDRCFDDPVHEFKSPDAAPTIEDRIDGFMGWIEDAIKRGTVPSIMRQYREGLKNIQRGINGIRKMMENKKISPDQKKRIIQKRAAQEYEKQQNALKGRERKRDPVTRKMKDILSILDILRNLIDAILQRISWEKQGKKGAVPRILVGFYTDARKRRRPITVAVA
jgi:hypothetical protein